MIEVTRELCKLVVCPSLFLKHFRPQRLRIKNYNLWLSGQVHHRKSAIHGLLVPVTLRMLRVRSDKSDRFWSQSIVFTKPFNIGVSLDLARGRDSWC